MAGSGAGADERLAAGKWTDEDEACVAGLRQAAGQHGLFEPDDAPPPLKRQARAVTVMLLAMGNASRVEAKADRPWPEERPPASEIAAAAAEAEQALTLLAETKRLAEMVSRTRVRGDDVAALASGIATMAASLKTNRRRG